MAYFPRSMDYKTAQEKRIKKLKQRLETAEKQMAEQALLRQKLEELSRARAEGTMVKKISHVQNRYKLLCIENMF